MLSLIARWYGCGKTQKAFCQEEGLTFSIFYYWLKRYRRELDEISFLHVEFGSGTSIEIRYPSGIILQFPSTTRLSIVKQCPDLLHYGLFC